MARKGTATKKSHLFIYCVELYAHAVASAPSHVVTSQEGGERLDEEVTLVFVEIVGTENVVKKIRLGCFEGSSRPKTKNFIACGPKKGGLKGTGVCETSVLFQP